jgi:hypothetical protein
MARQSFANEEMLYARSSIMFGSAEQSGFVLGEDGGLLLTLCRKTQLRELPLPRSVFFEIVACKIWKIDTAAIGLRFRLHRQNYPLSSQAVNTENVEATLAMENARTLQRGMSTNVRL